MSEELTLTQYRTEDRAEWDEFVREARNGTFLFRRGYMDYHHNTFEDCSLLVRDGKKRLVALLPANREGVTVVSHGGLTYGGFLVAEGTRTAQILEIFRAAASLLRKTGAERLLYKTIPAIYHSAPAEEDRYALFRMGAKLYRRDVLTVVDYRDRLSYQERRARTIRKARRAGVEMRESDDLVNYWKILEATLQARYGVDPVHSREEMELLRARFPDAIRLFAAFRGEEMLAGVVAYLSRHVCHLQYIAAGEEGKQLGALDVVVDALLEKFSEEVRFFDFGISNEDGGRYLNEGLVEYKEGFGARAVVHDFYELDLTRN